MRLGFSTIILLACLAGVSAPATGEEGDIVDRAALFPTTSLFYADLAGSFRWRTEIWQDVHLGLAPHVNKYGILPQLSDDGGGGKIRESTDLRLRLQPAIHVGERADIKAIVDLFSVQAGEGGASGIPGALSAGYGIPAPGSIDSPLSSAYVRAMWAEVHLFHLFNLQVGRVPAHWGMGLLENDGRNPDTDGGDAVDGVTLKANLGRGYSASISLDYPSEGKYLVTPYSPWNAPYDVGDLDDIWQWRLKFVSDPGLTADGTGVAWGIYSRLRWHDYSSLGAEDPTCLSANAWFTSYNCGELLWREAFFFTPDVWVKATTRLGPELLLTVEAEVVGRYGWMEATQGFIDDEVDTGKTFAGLGGVVRTYVTTPSLTAGVEGGMATGDEGSMAFGVLDRPVATELDYSAWSEGSPVRTNDYVTSFVLHPNFITDQILYRRVIGAVTNSFYLRPNMKYTLWGEGESSLWVKGSVMYAMAFVPSATPGEASALGLETDVALGAHFSRHVEARLESGMLFPGEGLSEASKLESPLPWATRLFLNFSF